MSLFDFFNKKKKFGELANKSHDNMKLESAAVIAQPRTCHVCGRKGLKYEREKTTDDSLDIVAICCVRCKSEICFSCRGRLPQYSGASRDGQLCPVCGKYTIYEMAGKADYSQLHQQAINRYGP